MSGHQQQQQDLQNEKSVVETEIESLKLEQTQREKKLGEKREHFFKKSKISRTLKIKVNFKNKISKM
ncbi:MAG: hypothetical protein Ct9H300mP28_10530 [Pseudomonadota bacterium]|nr:MAG: hypothetical protein Ct9H300mP28_10530 [Pseudomonadota bacterium]